MAIKDLWQIGVSTHSRPKAAGQKQQPLCPYLRVSTHSRPKAAGKQKVPKKTVLTFQLTAARRRLASYAITLHLYLSVSTHSRPKAAGILMDAKTDLVNVSTHSRPKAAGSGLIMPLCVHSWFQLTAARRRLGITSSKTMLRMQVSTHSRPKAAGASNGHQTYWNMFQLTAARRRLEHPVSLP